MKILAINIGNSRVAAGVVEDLTAGRVRYFEKVPPAGALRRLCAKPDGIMLASMVPARNAAWEEVMKQDFPAVPRLWMRPGMDFGIPIHLKAPEQTGQDRYASAVAAAAICGTPCIACDFGTATSFNLVLPRRGFTGGVIAPGYGMWFKALHAGTAQLPELKPDAALRLPFGGNTAEAMQLGARWGFRGMVAETLFQLTKAAGKQKVAYCATGGWAEQVMTDCGLDLVHVPHLTLIGLGLIYARNAR